MNASAVVAVGPTKFLIQIKDVAATPRFDENAKGRQL
jgi:hypothetical protein